MTDTTGDWLFDLGNSRLKLAPLAADGRVGDVVAHPHAALGQGAPMPTGRRAWVCSVASQVLTVALLQALASRFERISLARSCCSATSRTVTSS